MCNRRLCYMETSQTPFFTGRAPTLALSMGINHKCLKNMMVNTPPATHSANVDERFQAWQRKIEKKQEEYE